MTDADLTARTQNFKLALEYDGGRYAGWQRQLIPATIQGTLEKALASMTSQPITLYGSGRTDAGVHARGQVANFKCRTRLDPKTFLKGLNALLPDDIVILDCQSVPDEFHARFSARAKRYRYTVWNHPIPQAIGRQYAWHIRYPLDLEAMQKACPDIVGTHDFAAFTGSGSQPGSTSRRILSAQFCRPEHAMIHFDITGTGFLKHMVRNLVGTLVEIGQGRRPDDALASILKTRDRNQAGITAPARGLFLMAVFYDTETQSDPKRQTIGPG